ncbi:hypothetical protein FHS61_000581 [Altererythrobacter atlanticus]|uniref:Uncharacterized protein n=1 Tax=Croceibacterium atlanticum TaxID=1267766 RepID=A0A0F7KQK0_9SPHN|nr:XrtV sorting system accessory protein [Croceibacterium atlanticum]AKH42808.1 hypothetical protein WYH_01772 [Croceibacterium atlanticum]MBB5731588.1 hypothetical protein [Croceibacterium atlanticum]
MSTVFDWLSVLIFCGLAILYLQRSIAPPSRQDRVIAYLPPALGCAAGNYLGNEGYDWAAYALLAATGAYIIVILKPISRN